MRLTYSVIIEGKLSKLTKNQIINGQGDHKRIVHDKKWRKVIRSLLSA
jgi:hypothetical protein